jgi:hypothetical protein
MGVCGPWGNRSHLGRRRSRKTWSARRGKRRAVGIEQRRGIDIPGCLKIQETGSSQHQATLMHRVSVIVHCVIITTPTTITGIVFYSGRNIYSARNKYSVSAVFRTFVTLKKKFSHLFFYYTLEKAISYT